MKKILLALMFVSLACFAVTVVPKGSTKTTIPSPPYQFETEYLLFKILYYTPYGVPLKDSEGEIVLDEKGSPVIVFQRHVVQQTRVLRLSKWHEFPGMYWGVYDETGTEGSLITFIKWEPVTDGFFTSVIMENGDARCYFKITVDTNVDRGLGMSPAKMTLIGSMTMKPHNGRMEMSAGSGHIVGLGADDSRALEMAESASFANTPTSQLPVYGTFTVSDYNGHFTTKQLYNNIHSHVSDKVIPK